MFMSSTTRRVPKLAQEEARARGGRLLDKLNEKKNGFTA
jgi:hypothetical protein